MRLEAAASGRGLGEGQGIEAERRRHEGGSVRESSSPKGESQSIGMRSSARHVDDENEPFLAVEFEYNSPVAEAPAKRPSRSAKQLDIPGEGITTHF